MRGPPDLPPGWIGGTLPGPRAVDGSGPDSGPVILKLGGSMLALAGWPARVAALVQWFVGAGRNPTLVVGGGAVADGLRIIDAAATLPSERAHVLAIGCMTVTARLASESLDLPIVSEPSGRPSVLDAEGWLSRRRGAGLPQSWSVTSDSIAAAVAADTGAADGGTTLALVKRVPPDIEGGDPRRGLASLAAQGWVDPHFPVVADRLRIEWFAPDPSLPGPA